MSFGRGEGLPVWNLTGCRAAELALSIFQVKPRRAFRQRGGTIAKGVAVLLPIIQMCLMRSSALQSNVVAFFAIANGIMSICLGSGSLLLLAILCRYIHTRRQIATWNVRYGEHSSAGTNTAATSSSGPTLPRQGIHDRWLVIRFSIAFVALGGFQLVTILFEVSSAANSKQAVASGHADLSIGRAKTDFVLFMPGVSPSLLTFLVFGTTKTFRAYLWRKLVPKKIRERRAQQLAAQIPQRVKPAAGGAQLQPSTPAESHVSAVRTPVSDGDGISLQALEVGNDVAKGKDQDDTLPIWRVREMV